MIGRIPRWLLLVGIVTAPIGCDNVSWGGMSVRLEHPSSDSVEAPGNTQQEDPDKIVYGPLLFAGTRDGDSAVVVPVAELVDGRPHSLPQGEEGSLLARQILEERMAPGQALSLYHQGSRIGTFTISVTLGVDEGFCPPRPGARGHLELIPSAVQADRFLALASGVVPGTHLGAVQNLEPTRAQRNAAQNLAGEALNELRAPWPPALQDIRRDLQVFQIRGHDGPGIAVTFAYQDELLPEPPGDEAYALFLLGEPAAGRLQRTFTWYRPVATEGKGAPRLFSWMDWDGDGRDEILLEVFGAQARWWAALGQEGDRAWSVIFQDSCGLSTDPS